MHSSICWKWEGVSIIIGGEERLCVGVGDVEVQMDRGDVNLIDFVTFDKYEKTCSLKLTFKGTSIIL